MNFRARVSHHHSPCRAAVRTCSAAMELAYWSEMEPSCGDAGGTSRHETQLKTKVYLRRRTKVSDKRRWYLRRPTKVKQKKSRAARRARSPLKKQGAARWARSPFKKPSWSHTDRQQHGHQPTTTHMVHHHSFSKAQTIRRSASGPTATSPKKKRRRRSAEGAISDRRRSAEGGPTYMRGPPRSGELWAMNEKQRKTWENKVSHAKREA